jgi:hypothetical protein
VIPESLDTQESGRQVRRSIHHEVAENLADHGRELEAMPGESAANDDVLMMRVPIEDEMAIR